MGSAPAYLLGRDAHPSLPDIVKHNLVCRLFGVASTATRRVSGTFPRSTPHGRRSFAPPPHQNGGPPRCALPNRPFAGGRRGKERLRSNKRLAASLSRAAGSPDPEPLFLNTWIEYIPQPIAYEVD